MLYIKTVDCRIEWPVFPPGLAVTDGEVGAVGESGISTVFRLTVELFAYIDSELSHFEAGSASSGSTACCL